jgi:prepilin-type N-terminal cleavage/methylation domain-containing protein
MKPHPRGFTLIEVLVVIGIIGILMAILIPTLNKSREAAKRVQCASNMRQFGQACFSYATANKGRCPPKGSNKEYPYSWSKPQLVFPLMRYGLQLQTMVCPSTDFCNPPKDDWFGHMNTDPVNGDYIVCYGYLVGLADPETMAGGFPGVWYENPPTAASYKLAKKPIKIMLVDINLYFAAGDNGFDFNGPVPSVRWFYSNHANKNRFDPSRVDLRTFVKGSNRLYSDGSVRWVLPDDMGRDDGMITSNPQSARYSHSGGDARPYYW